MDGVRDGTGFKMLPNGDRVRARNEFRDKQLAANADRLHQEQPREINIVLQVSHLVKCTSYFSFEIY